MKEREVVVVTDYAADLPDDLSQFGIRQIPKIPLGVSFDTEDYLTGIDIDLDLYRKRVHQYWEIGKIIPKTHTTGIDNFSKFYKDPVEAGYNVLSIHIGDNLSNTGNIARAAANEFPTGRVKIYDTGTLSMAEGFMAIEAQKAAESGATIKEITKILDSQRERSHVRVITPNIPYLKASGRANKLVSIFASALSIIPIIQLDHNIVGVDGKPRTMRGALDWSIKFVENIGPVERICLLDYETEPYSQLLNDRLINELGISKEIIYRGEIGPLTGSHCGPGGLGLIVIRK
jgi:DegV family protein with EDD domain